MYQPNQICNCNLLECKTPCIISCIIQKNFLVCQLFGGIFFKYEIISLLDWSSLDLILNETFMLCMVFHHRVFNKGIQHELSSAVELLFVTHLGDSGPFSRISSVDSSICMLIISSSETLRTPLCQKVKYIFVADHRTTFDSRWTTHSAKKQLAD